MGRKQKPYQTSWKDIIPGLARDTNGRWRITATGFRYSEPNERRAVERFYQITGTKREPEMEQMSAPDMSLVIDLVQWTADNEIGRNPYPLRNVG